jgi:hypothetical protein
MARRDHLALMARRRYGTPMPPLMRARLRSGRRWSLHPRRLLAAMLSPEHALKLVVAFVALLIVLAIALRALTPPPEPVLSDERGETYASAAVSFVAPRDWIVLPGASDLRHQEPWRLFAPQTDTSRPPTVITFFALPITRYHAEAVADLGLAEDAEPDAEQLLAALVDRWLNELAELPGRLDPARDEVVAQQRLDLLDLLENCPSPERSTLRLNPDAASGTVRGVAVVLDWQCDRPWYGGSLEPVAGTSIRHRQVLLLPGTRSFNTDTERRMLVIDLSYPSDVDVDTRALIERAFANVFLGSLKVH